MPNNNNKRLSLEQKRAKYAYECAEKGSNLDKAKKVDKAYKAYVKKTPMLIKTNGLGATLAFIRSKMDTNTEKKGYAYERLYNHIGGWLSGLEIKIIELNSGDDLVNKVISLESPVYRAVTIEVLAFLNWLRRFAEGLIEGEDDE